MILIKILFVLFVLAAIFAAGVAFLFAIYIAILSLLNPTAGKLLVAMVKGDYEKTGDQYYVFTEYDAEVANTNWDRWYIYLGSEPRLQQSFGWLAFSLVDWMIARKETSYKLQKREPVEEE